MPALKNVMHEAFALAVARGTPVGEAYVACYPGDRAKMTSQVKASKLMKRPEVADRITEIRQALTVRTSITQQRVLEELAKIGFANMGDMIELQDGRSHVDLAKLTPEQKAAISEIQIDTSEDGKQRVKVKLHDKRAALMDIGKHLGMFREKIEVSGPNGGPITSVNTVEVSLLAKEERQMLKDMLLAIAERKAQRESEVREMKTIEGGEDA